MGFDVGTAVQQESNTRALLERSLLREGAYGIHAAAQTYFGKQPSDLTLGESALWLGSCGPLGPFSLCESKAVLGAAGLGSAPDGSPGLHFQRPWTGPEKNKVQLAKRPGGSPYFIDYLTEELVRRYGPNLVFRGSCRWRQPGSDMQRSAQQAWNPDLQGALVALDPKSGHIRAMVGGRNYGKASSTGQRRPFASQAPPSSPSFMPRL